jgi:hypothetical protein
VAAAVEVELEVETEPDAGRPISYMALQVGTPVLSTSGTEFGTVEHVLQIPSEDVFDGIVVKTHHHDVRFIDRDQVDEMTTTAVRSTVSDEDIDALPKPRGTLAERPDLERDEGTSLTARWGRLFGRTHWKELD